MSSAQPAPETTCVRDTHKFDEIRLQKYLQANLLDYAGPLSIRQFEGGQSNPTFLLETPAQRYVLRKKPPGNLLPSAHQVEREYKVMAALKQTSVPVPAVYLLCEDPSVIGTPFFVMQYVQGRVLRDPALPELPPEERKAIYREMITRLASLHKVDFEAVGLSDYGRRQGYAARQIARWSKQYEASKTQTISAMDKLLQWLPAHIPNGDDSGCDIAIVHGDYRLENTIVHSTQSKILAVLDWELSTLGNPLADVAYNCLLYYMPASDTSFNGFAGLDLKLLGIPEQDEYIQIYCESTGRDGIPNLPFFLVFALFRSAAIAQGIMKRAIQGNASSSGAKKVGEFAKQMAELAWSLAQKVKS